MATDHPCERPANGIGVIPFCISIRTDGEFGYWFAVASPGPGTQFATFIVRHRISYS